MVGCLGIPRYDKLREIPVFEHHPFGAEVCGFRGRIRRFPHHPQGDEFRRAAAQIMQICVMTVHPVESPAFLRFLHCWRGKNGRNAWGRFRAWLWRDHGVGNSDPIGLRGRRFVATNFVGTNGPNSGLVAIVRKTDEACFDGEVVKLGLWGLPRSGETPSLVVRVEGQLYEAIVRFALRAVRHRAHRNHFAVVGKMGFRVVPGLADRSSFGLVSG